jgi:hypothetical protein
MPSQLLLSECSHRTAASARCCRTCGMPPPVPSEKKKKKKHVSMAD